MKKALLILIGLIPFVLGFLMNAWLMQNQDSVLPFKLIGILFLVCWGLIGFITYNFEKTPLKSTVILHIPAFLVLLLIMFQNIILAQSLSNFLGWATQFYYLPLLNLSTTIEMLLPFNLINVWMTCLIAFLLMIASYYLGCYLTKFRSK